MSTGIEIFCDGACLGNPGPGGWGTILIDHAQDAVTERGGYEKNTTNNAMEIRAALEGLKAALSFAGLPLTIEIKTDSAYVIQGATKWLSGWVTRGWKTKDGGDVANIDLWKEILEVLKKFPPTTRLIWQHVPGHSGVVGNERADQIAATFASGEKPELYQGEKSNYLKSASPHSARFPIYLSLVDGKLERHVTWFECEARVKGASGARFKKVSSPIEETQTLKTWNLIK